MVAAIAAWLIVTGVSSLGTVLAAEVITGAVVTPVIKLLGAAVLLGLYYYGFWAESQIREVLQNIFSIPELVKKLVFTIALLCIYRIGFHVPLPGLNQQEVVSFMTQQAEEGILGQAMTYFAMFTGGTLSQATLFGLGIMPYISASIIFQLLTTVVPALERLQKEGPTGYKKIQEYTRYATVGLCIVQAAFWMNFMRTNRLLYPEWRDSYLIYVVGIFGLTAGTIFLMWLGEQIDEYGIGNGISLIIMAGIVSRLPRAVLILRDITDLRLISSGETGNIGVGHILFLVAAFVFVVAGTILITQAQRRIPVQQAKHTRGRRVYGGQRHYLPLRVNHGGVIPIIFASSLMIFPNLLFGWINQTWGTNTTQMLYNAFTRQSYIYWVIYIVLIFFFAYFWTTVQFRPKDMAEQLRDYGSFIPGLRPGKRTADYLERVMERVTYCGAAFLAVIAVIPMVIAAILGIPTTVSAFLGGTGLLIVVSVTLDLVQRIEANLLMHNYSGFLGGSTRIRGAYR